MTRITALLFTAILIFGCGGGGSSRPAPMAPETPPPPQPPAQPQISASDIQTADPEGTLSAATQAAESTPWFGSVVVSNQTPTDLSSSFSDQHLAVTVSRQSRSPITIDTGNALYIDDSGTGASLVGLSGRSGRSWGVTSATQNSATLSRVAVDWASNDVSDYLAGGYWLHIEGNVLTGTITSIGIGAFVDGPEIDMSRPASIPIQGTATYRGNGSGGYIGCMVLTFQVWPQEAERSESSPASPRSLRTSKEEAFRAVSVAKAGFSLRGHS